MSTDPSLPLQGAIYAALSADAAQAAMGVAVGIYDRAPPQPSYPYIEIGAVLRKTDRAVGFDGSELDVTLQIWSRAVGSVEAKTIAAAASDILAPLQNPETPAPLAIDGHKLLNWEVLGSETLQDPNDPLATHVPLRLRYRTQPLPA